MNAAARAVGDQRPVPAAMLENWQKLITNVAEAVHVPAGLVTRILSSDRIRMEVASSQAGNPYPHGSVDTLLDGMYCARVLSGDGELLVADATAGGLPSLNPDVELGMIAYLGYPVSWPDGRPFGTICVLDNHPNFFDTDARHLLSMARDAIEAELELLLDTPASRRPPRRIRDASSPSSRGDVEGADKVFWDYEVDRGIIRLSRGASRFFGLSPLQASLSRDEWLALFSPSDGPALVQMFQVLAKSPGDACQVSATVADAKNESIQVAIGARGVTDSCGSLRWVLGTQSITAGATDSRGHADVDPRPAQRTLPTRLVVDAQGRIVMASPDCADLLGHEPQALVGRHVARSPGSDRGLDVLWPSVDAALHERVIEQSFHWKPDSGRAVVAVRIASLLVDDRIVGAEMAFRTLPDRHAAEGGASLFRQVRDDAGGHQAELDLRLDQMRLNFALTGQRHALVVVEAHDLPLRAELDGHDVAAWTARRLSATARARAEGQVVADIALGKAAIAGWGLGENEATTLAVDIVRSAAAEIEQAGLPCRLSAGIAQVDSLSVSASELLRLALSASATAAEADPPVGVYSTGNPEADRHYHRATVAKAVRAALGDNRLIIHGQPIRALGEPRDAFGQGYEILVRMLDVNGDMVPAASFIPAAETFGLISALDLLVLKKSVIALANAPIDVHFNVNLSAISLGRKDLWSYAAGLLDRTGVAPSRLTFEITESALMTGAVSARAFVEQARRAGCRIALDDFGTGMSSFTYLSEFGVDYIKIDRSFVLPSLQPGPARILLESMNDIAHRLGARSVAEGIETADHLALMQAIGIDLAQGYFIGRPAPLPFSSEEPLVDLPSAHPVAP